MAPAEPRPIAVNADGSRTVLAAVAGFVAGGALARQVADVAGVVVAVLDALFFRG